MKAVKNRQLPSLWTGDMQPRFKHDILSQQVNMTCQIIRIVVSHKKLDSQVAKN